VSRFVLAVKNYRIIKQAKLEPEGITLVYGQNGNGKSSIIKALVSLLSNQHSEDNFRHGQGSYAIAARCGDTRLVYTRAGDQSSVRFNDEGERKKLGRGPMYQVEPRFPLKRIDYEDSSFFPNIAFQNGVPVFGEISCTDLMSSLFSSVARLSERVNACKSESAGLAKRRDASENNIEMLKKKVAESSRSVDELENDNAGIEERYKSLSELVRKKAEVDRFDAEYDEYSEKCGDDMKRGMARLYDEALPLFPELLKVQKAEKVIAQLIAVKDELEQVKKEAAAVPDVSPVIISSVVSLFQFRKRLEEAHSELAGVPVVSHSLVSMVGKLGRLQGERAGLGDALSVVADDLDKAESGLKSAPCARHSQGHCPLKVSA
jgi:chromosome segregation ATPase